MKKDKYAVSKLEEENKEKKNTNDEEKTINSL